MMNTGKISQDFFQVQEIVKFLGTSLRLSQRLCSQELIFEAQRIFNSLRYLHFYVHSNKEWAHRSVVGYLVCNEGTWVRFPVGPYEICKANLNRFIVNLSPRRVRFTTKAPAFVGSENF